MQATNIFFMNSEIKLEDNVFDIFEADEKSINIFQEKGRYEY